MKYFYIIGMLLGLACPGIAAVQDMYFNAMQDEMTRTLANLHLKNHVKPYYVAYWLEDWHIAMADASFGALFGENDARTNGRLGASVLVGVGSDQTDQLGYADEPNGYVLPQESFVPASYEGIRTALWKLTDSAYVEAVDLYQKKQDYKKQKNIVPAGPDVVPAKQTVYTEEVPAWDPSELPALSRAAVRISALGNAYDFLEQFTVSVVSARQDSYYLNSRGAKAVVSRPFRAVLVRAELRLPDGKVENESLELRLRTTQEAELARAQQQTRQFLEKLARAYHAKQGEAYIGPVLLKPQAAAVFLEVSGLKGMEQSNALLLNGRDDDPTAGTLHKKTGVRVGTELLTLYDRPDLRTYDGFSLPCFAPVDDEGVKPQPLTLMRGGKTQQFPASQRPLTKAQRSNGHAFRVNRGRNQVPREKLTTVVAEPVHPLSQEQLEEQLLARCRQLGLDYGYIVHNYDINEGVLRLERVYTDGRREPVLGMKWDSALATPRNLRSVLAVGGVSELVPRNLLNRSCPELITPSLLLDEAELVPAERKAQRKPFITKPKN